MKANAFPAASRAGRSLFMPIPSAVAFFSSLLLLSCGTTQKEVLSEANSVEKRFSSRLQPAVKTWIDDEAVKLTRFVAEEDAVQKAMGRRFAGQNLGDEGREVLTFLILVRSAELSSQRAKIFENQERAAHATIEKMREVLPKLQADLKRNADLHDLAPVPTDYASYQEEFRKIGELMRTTPTWTVFVPRNPEDIGELRAAQDELKAKLDGMNEMSEMTSMRLQMMMDRRSKFISTLSNLMKKISTTQESVVQNLK
jgi:hypothetical protein